MEQKKTLDDEKRYHETLKARYKKEADVRKYKHRMATRHQNKNSIDVLQSLNQYSKSMIAMRTDDEILYNY